MHVNRRRTRRIGASVLGILLAAGLGYTLAAQTVTGMTGADLQREALRYYYQGRDSERREGLESAMSAYNEAIRICMDDITYTGGNAQSYVTLVWTLQRQQRYEEVISWSEEGRLRFPADPRFFEIMGEASFYLNQWDQCLDYMQRYVNEVPQTERAATAYFFIGEVFRLRKQFQRADMAYSVAVRLEPKMPLWWYRLGAVREAAGARSDAQIAYERALQLAPKYQAALEGLARIREDSGA